MSIQSLVPEDKIESILTRSHQKALESLAEKLREQFSDTIYVFGTPDHTKYLDKMKQYIDEHSDYYVTDVIRDPIAPTVHITIEPKPIKTFIEIDPSKNSMFLLHPDERTLWGKKEDSTDNGN